MNATSSGMSSGKLRWLKLGLSLFLVYHLSTILLMPNSSSLLGRKTSWLFLSYANTMNFNTTWQFFSPGPSPTFYLEYEVEMPGDRESISAPLMYPPQRKGLVWDDAWNRRLFGMRFFALTDNQLERFFIPYLCRENPGAEAISSRGVVEKVEDIERAGEWASFKESQRLDLPRQRISCPPKPGAGT